LAARLHPTLGSSFTHLRRSSILLKDDASTSAIVYLFSVDAHRSLPRVGACEWRVLLSRARRR
jgi:hypothetical protein